MPCVRGHVTLQEEAAAVQEELAAPEEQAVVPAAR